MNKKGFTLVELLAVIVILGLITTIVATKGFGAFDKTKNKITDLNDNAIVESAKVLRTEIEQCDDDTDSELLKILMNNSIISEKKCDAAKNVLSNCFITTIGFLKDNDYVSGNTLKDYSDSENIKICKDEINLGNYPFSKKNSIGAYTLYKSVANHNVYYENSTQIRENAVSTIGKSSSKVVDKGSVGSGCYNITNSNSTFYYVSDYIYSKYYGCYSITVPEGSLIYTTNYNALIGKYIIDYVPTRSKWTYGSCYFTVYKVNDKSTDNKICYDKYTTSYESMESTFSSTEDDYGISYYYRGGINDNYVNFANMCWRIVRIEGDGSIKIVLLDQNNICQNESSNWEITPSSYKRAMFGYNYNSDETKMQLDFLNATKKPESTAAYYLEDFQQRKLNDFNSYLKEEEWCYNDKVYSDENGKNELSVAEKEEYYNNNIPYYYDTYVRFIGTRSLDFVKKPTLKCNGSKITKYKDNTIMYAGLLTADEVSFAGSTITNSYDYSTNNLNFYLFSKNNIMATFSPLKFDGSRESILYLNNATGSLSTGTAGEYGIRPAVVLKPSVKLSNSKGTKDDPYVVS